MSHSARTLVVFDVDGTLVDSREVDGSCFGDALRQALGLELHAASWDTFERVSDEGILRQSFRSAHGRDPQPDEIALAKERFEQLLAPRCRELQPIPGAVQTIERMRDACSVAIATGGWRAGSAMKLAAVGLDLDSLPHACAEDGPSREDILRTAIGRAAGSFEQIVYVGDGPWDHRAALRVGTAFIGVGPQLRGACAHWVPDLLHPLPVETATVDRTAFFAHALTATRESYLAEPHDIFRQSGRSCGAERWAESRRCIATAIHRDGDFLDIGCANGLLLESVVRWGAEAGHSVRPHGIDVVPELVELARARLPEHVSNLTVANVQDWEPDRAYDFIRTELTYVPAVDEARLVRRLRSALRPGGRLIVCNYRSLAHGPPAPAGARLTNMGFVPGGLAEAPGTSMTWLT